MAHLPVEFYLTGGTALSREYLHHRYSDDLDFFVNNSDSFKNQFDTVVGELKKEGLLIEIATNDESFARIMVINGKDLLKIDFVNDIEFREGRPIATSLFVRTDNWKNILTNKISALSRYSAKDVVDLIYLSHKYSFNWEEMINIAVQKDLWVNPLSTADILEQFPVEKINQIVWLKKAPDVLWIKERIEIMIKGIIYGDDNHGLE